MSKHLALIFSDLQIHDYKQYNPDGQRLPNCLKVLDDIGQFCSRNKITTIFFTGDWYDQKKVLPIVVVNETIKAVIQFAKKYPNIKIFAVSGNHGLATKSLSHSKGVSAIQHIAEIIPENFVIVDNTSAKVTEDIWVHGIPYYEFKEDFEEKLRVTGADAAHYKEDGIRNYLLIHQTPKGIGNSIIDYECDPKDKRFTSLFDFVFCGHIHKRQQLTPNFLVVGSPIHRDAGDIGETKGFVVMNLYKPEKGFIFKELKGYPEFVQSTEVTEEQAEGNFVVDNEPVQVTVASTIADTKKFNTGLQNEELVKNYWKEVDGEDEEKLKIGLQLLK